MSTVREFTYKPRVIPMVLGIVFFGVCAVVAGFIARSDEERVRVFFMELSGEKAAIFYWILCGLSVGFVLVAIFGLMTRPLRNHRITIDNAALAMPRFIWSRNDTVVLLDEILEVEMMKIRRERFMVVHHGHGRLNISQSMMADRSEFEELYRLLTQATTVEGTTRS